INITKEKKLTNMRSSTGDELERLARSRKLGLEEALEFCSVDEYVEVAPQVVRVRKVTLDGSQRAKERTRAKSRDRVLPVADPAQVPSTAIASSAASAGERIRGAVRPCDGESRGTPDTLYTPGLAGSGRRRPVTRKGEQRRARDRWGAIGPTSLRARVRARGHVGHRVYEHAAASRRQFPGRGDLEACR